MTAAQGVALISHQSALIIEFDSATTHAVKKGAHTHDTRQHASAVRSEHEFFGSVCDSLDGIAKVIVAGGHTGLADFKHYVTKHRPQTAPHILAYDVVDHPTENQLVAFARKRFDELETLASPPTAR
jgi:stalled ribosome rescue protein Dom34